MHDATNELLQCLTRGAVCVAKESRPWGFFECYTETPNQHSWVKRLTLHAGKSLSLQTHEHRAEFWLVLGGSGVIRVGEKVFSNIKSGDTFFIPPRVKHRATGGPCGLIILEEALAGKNGKVDEGDIKRYEDDFGRATTAHTQHLK